ncbi:hypothetical protein AA313_de0200784 [Arthrobotrys entomopaga]|nr:hypothetical protein AA313_de0200784 [Arthrobotrys entomopaga]
MIGWEDDNNVVGSIAAAAKISLIRLIPHIMPAENSEKGAFHLYRFVLEHGDFGIHNMSITVDPSGEPLITSLYDWETGCILPAILSDPLMAVWVDLVTDDNGTPSITRVPKNSTSGDLEQYDKWAKQYFETGKDARHIWFALRDWRGDNPEEYFGNLGMWADQRMKDLGIG